MPKTKKTIKVRDLKPSKDAKGGKAINVANTSTKDNKSVLTSQKPN